MIKSGKNNTFERVVRRGVKSEGFRKNFDDDLMEKVKSESMKF